MTCLEHLIENTLVAMKGGASFQEVKRLISKDPNLKYAGITIDQCWEICQYFYYDYLPSAIENANEEKLK